LTSATRVAAFVALAAFAAAHWATLVEGPPVGRVALAVAAIVAGAALLEAIGRAQLRQLPAGLLAAAVGVAATGLALAAIGIAPRLLWPAGWGELAANLDYGLAGLAGPVDYPYGGDNAWSRLAILAVAPLALGLAATVAFWPTAGSGRGPLRIAGLAVLIAVYAGAVATNPPDGALVRGLALLALVAAWLWLPAIRRRDALFATVMVAVAGAIAVPAAAELDASDPWLDYHSWKLRSAEGTTYQWEHSYGPIDWPRDGTELLAVQSEQPHYWKTVVLDRFDGVRWRRAYQSPGGARDLARTAAGEALPADAEANAKWLKRFKVTVGDLDSEVVVGAGTPIRVQGLGAVAAAADGTTVAREGPLGKGDAYFVTAYVPDPTAEEMRAAAQGYPSDLARYTRIELSKRSPVGSTTSTAWPLAIPLRGNAANNDPLAGQLADTPYGEVYELARRLVDAQPTDYDAVRAIQDHLRSEYEYSEFPPRRSDPIAAFLFEDRIGYCQQFSGAMALMLRMAGIPSRVVSGFAPGTRERERDVFRVEDFDAHAWVEVYFNGIGWVAFDPTPSAAPASSQQVPGLPTADVAQSRVGPDSERSDTALGGAPGGDAEGGSSAGAALLAVPASLLLALSLAAPLVGARALRHRALAPATAAEAELVELGKALERFGWPAADGATLLGVEHHLHRARRRAASRYVARLRAIRYASREVSPPSLSERRALRRELSSAGGLGGRLRALVAIPPGGPRIPK
jgi:protein-glutamine gamma-glutamyltransferase